MNSQQLRSFLTINNTNKAPDWDIVKNIYNPEPIELIDGDLHE